MRNLSWPAVSHWGTKKRRTQLNPADTVQDITYPLKAFSKRSKCCRKRNLSTQTQTHDLQLHGLALHLNGSDLEVHPDGADVTLSVRVILQDKPPDHNLSVTHSHSRLQTAFKLPERGQPGSSLDSISVRTL